MMVSVGLGWACVGFMFVPGSHIHNLILMMAFCGTLAGGALSSGPSDFFGFSVASLLATLVLMFQLQVAFGDQAVVLQVTCVLYFFVLFMASRNVRLTLLEAINLRLTNAKLAEQNAANALRAEKANREKSEFLAAASHDLRQPVHALLLLVEAYRQQVSSAADHPLLGHIASAGQSINSLFNALMELSQLESGTEKIVLTTFDLSEAIGRVLNRVQPDAEQRGLKLRYVVARSLVPASPVLAVHTDRLLLKRVLTNLLSNAVRYTSHGGVLLAVRPTHGGRGGLCIEVWDTGIGIAAADIPHIFDPYVQIGNLERDRSKGLGLGLGLAIASHAAELLGLQLTAHSKPGRGSCFRLSLPQALCKPCADIYPAAPTSMPAILMPKLIGRRVLLVEDDAMVQHAMQALLGGWQVDLRCAIRGDMRHVLEICGPDWQPECVLCDVRLPGPLDGIALLELLLANYPRAVGILQTGEPTQSVEALAEDAGYLLLPKPVAPNVLASTLATVLAQPAVNH
jgi:signal transduction histidine kinase